MLNVRYIQVYLSIYSIFVWQPNEIGQNSLQSAFHQTLGPKVPKLDWYYW